MYTCCLALLLFFQTYGPNTEIGKGVRAMFERIDAMSQHISTQPEAEKFAEALFGTYYYGAAQDFPQRKEWKRKLATAEVATAKGTRPAIGEQDVADAYNRTLEYLNLPEFRVTRDDVHARRSSLSRVYPKTFGRQPDGTIAPNCRPIEAAYLLFQFDLLNEQLDVPDALKKDKVGSAAFIERARRYLRAKKEWKKTHKDEDFQKAAVEVAH